MVIIGNPPKNSLAWSRYLSITPRICAMVCACKSFCTLVFFSTCFSMALSLCASAIESSPRARSRRMSSRCFLSSSNCWLFLSVTSTAVVLPSRLTKLSAYKGEVLNSFRAKARSALPRSILTSSLARSTKDSGGDLNSGTSKIDVVDFTCVKVLSSSLKRLKCSSCCALSKSPVTW